MNNYIKDFSIEKIDTYIAYNPVECNILLNLNKRRNTFEMFHNNIRSLNKNIDELRVVLAELDRDFECIVLTETWRLTDISLLKLPGYSLIYNEASLNQNDGTVIYIKSHLNYSFEFVDLDVTKIISLKILYPTKTIHVISIYRSPSTCILTFNKCLYTYLSSILQNTHQINILVGDINIDLTQRTERCEEYLNALSEWGYISTINEYTRIQGASRSCIDHIFLNSNIDGKHCKPIILKTNITDHYALVFQLNLDCPLELKKGEGRETFKLYLDKIKLKAQFQLETWGDIYGHDVNTGTTNFIEKIKQKITECTQKKRLNRKEVKRNDWITPSLIKSVNKKNKLYKQMQKNPENHLFVNQFKKYKNTLTELLRAAKTNYFRTQLEKNKDNPSRIWQCMKKINNESRENQELKEIKDQKGSLIKDSKKMAEILNDYFSNVGRSLAEKIVIDPDAQFKETKLPNSIYLSETNPGEVKKTIMSLKCGTAPGPDGITSDILKEIAPYIIEPLTFLINQSFQSGSFPEEFKMAIIKPLYKSGDKTEPVNYRPISLISNLSKIFEKILKTRIESYLDKYRIISKNQYGFKKAVSTEDAMAALIGKIYNSLDKSKPSICVFVDLAKAFDTVSHAKLLLILENIGFRGMPLRLLHSYLNNRRQCVRVNGEVSGSKSVQYGVPQGTVLGPVLFTIYINDLFNIDSQSNIISFADDTAVFYQGNSWEELRRVIEGDFTNIVKWFNCRLLSINLKKTLFVPFTSYSDSLPTFNSICVNFNNKVVEIESCNKIKYLGVIIDCHLRWNFHIDYVTQKIRCLLSKFRLYRDIFNEQHLKMLYFALVQSHLTYGIIAWGGVVNKYLSKLNVIQKWILKIMFKKSILYPTTSLFKDARVFDVRQLFFEKMALRLFHKKDCLPSAEHEHYTRHREGFVRKPKIIRTVGQRCFNYLISTVYNEISEIVRTVHSRGLFKKLIKNYLLNVATANSIHQLLDEKNSYNITLA